MAEKIPIVDLTKELLLHIEGDKTQKHTIPWDILRNVGDKLQSLIITLAKYSLEEGDVTTLDNFTLEFTGFYDGSATPAFSLNTQPTPTLYNSDNKIRKNLNADFSKVMYLVDKGNFQQIADTYNTQEVSNDVITKVFDFTNSAGTAPVQIVKRKTKGKGYTKVFTIRKLSKDGYDQLYIKKKDSNLLAKTPDQTAVGKVILRQGKSGRVSKKLAEIYMENDAVLSLKIDHIVTLERRYELNTPIYFQFYQEGKGMVIENEQFDLFAAGKTLDQAKQDLNNQFDHTYQRLNQLKDRQLSDRLVAIKKSYNFIVKKVIKA
ncbi:MAG: hypothetical protein IPJ81_12075 [Chitinophagaceae bacterium]|nr:hypothetical protein [Chitinophagaceae bacterium]